MSVADIVVVGSLNTDLVTRVKRFPGPGETLVGEDFQTYCGGKGANQAYAAARLGGNVAMVGQVGADDFGTAQIENLSSVGVQTDHVQRDAAQPTGTAIIGVDASGENRIILVPGANHTFAASQLDHCQNLLSGTGLLLLQLEIPRATVGEAIRIARASGTQVILDPAPAAPIPEEWFPSIDFLTPNLSELRLLTGDSLEAETPLETIAASARRLCHRGIRNVIAKLGSRGAVRITSQDAYHWPAIPVPAVDTTAAGDCFNAAFAAHRATGHTIAQAGEFAVAAAALSITKKGAQPSMPSRSEVAALIQDAKRPDQGGLTK